MAHGAGSPQLTSMQVPVPAVPNTAAEWQPQFLALLQNPSQLLASSMAASSQLDQTSLLHLPRQGLSDVFTRPLQAPMGVAKTPAVPSPELPGVVMERPLAPVEMQRAAWQTTMVQVDDLLCNPPCATGRGVCARDASGSAHALDGGAPRCFCRSPYTGIACDDADKQPPSTWSDQLALVSTKMQTLLPDSYDRGPRLQAASMALAVVSFAVLLGMCCGCLPCQQRERGINGCLMPWRRANNPAENAPLLRGPQQGHMGNQEAGQSADNIGESWARRQGRSIGRRRPGFESVPQAFKDESDEES